MTSIKQKIKKELPKMYLNGRRDFRTQLRRHCLRNQKYDVHTIKDFIFDMNCPIGIPRGKEEISLFVRYIMAFPKEHEIIEVQDHFNNMLSEIIFDEFRKEVNIKKHSRKRK